MKKFKHLITEEIIKAPDKKLEEKIKNVLQVNKEPYAEDAKGIYLQVKENVMGTLTLKVQNLF